MCFWVGWSSYYHYYFTPWEFFFYISVNWVFEWLQISSISSTLLSILADLNNTVVWTVFTSPVISKSFSPCTNPLVTVPRAPITIGITVTFIFQFFSFSSSWRNSAVVRIVSIPSLISRSPSFFPVFWELFQRLKLQMVSSSSSCFPYYYYYYFTLLWIFHTSIRWWIFARV